MCETIRRTHAEKTICERGSMSASKNNINQCFSTLLIEGVVTGSAGEIIKLAEYYGVSIDYLVGLTDEPKHTYPRKKK